MPVRLECSVFLKGFILVCCFLLTSFSLSHADNFEMLGKYIGNNDAILLADSEDNILYSKNAGKQMVPASTIKIFTTLAAFHFLGKDFRFQTEFYLDHQRNLVIKGYGDPYLVSEIVGEIAKKLAPRLEPAINNVIVDDSYFSKPLTIPGLSSTLQPYDAPNGALCVNFNTVNFKPGPTPGTFISAELQTPLLPFALKRIVQSGHHSNRIVLSHNENEIALYAGLLFRYFLKKNGVHVRGEVKTGQLNQKNSQMILTYHSRFNLEKLSQKLLEHSNNFIANQLLITLGIKKFGPPGNLEKGIEAATIYAQNQLNLDNITIAEGSGISRKNKVCATTMLKILDAFKPYYCLMKKEKQAFYKTGTLYGVSNLAGYIECEKGLCPFVIFINSKDKQALPIMEVLVRKK
jgi:D-alanyl-D-alanine carboxypeptidase/D-alanyl-D-alanine-endopeptidase (penicillin-binding protein 4)